MRMTVLYDNHYIGDKVSDLLSCVLRVLASGMIGQTSDQ